MRVGPEQFILKDFAFIDAMIAPVIGHRTLAIYDVLRRHIWRTSERGSPRSRDAFKAGKLVTTISRQKLAAVSGTSVRTIQRHLNKLRAIGWVRSESGDGSGETVVYELGERRPGETEMFYADNDARNLWLGLEELALDRDVVSVTSLPCDVRLEFTRAWFTRTGGTGDTDVTRSVGTGDTDVTRVVTTVSPGVVTQMSPRIENPPGAGIEKSEEHSGRGAPESVSAAAAEPRDRPRAREDMIACSSSRSNVDNDFCKNEEHSSSSDKNEEQEPKFALDNTSVVGDDGAVRMARAEELIEEAKEKADSQRELNDLRRVEQRLRESRTKQLEAGRVNEQRAANLKGKQFPQAVYAQARHVWDVYVQLLHDLDSTIPTVRWNAEGNVKARGQVCRLVDMYGGETTELAVRYVVGNWEKIGARYFKDPGGVPNLGRLVALHEPLVREAVLWGQHRDVLEEWEQWYADHPMESAPDELKERYGDAHKALSALGFGA